MIDSPPVKTYHTPERPRALQGGIFVGSEPDKEGLDALNDRIAALKKTQQPEARADEHYSKAQLGWRMVTELVAGLLIGFGIGYGLDWVFGTLPLFLVLFVLLGLAAGIKTMMRTAKEIEADEAAHAARRNPAAAAARKEDTATDVARQNKDE